MKYFSLVLVSAIVHYGSQASDVPIQLTVSPVHHSLCLGEPAVFTLELSNRSNSPVKGIFVPLESGFAGLVVEITEPVGRKYVFARDEIVDDIIYNESVMKPGDVVRSSITILYDMVHRYHVFNQTGRYSLSFIFLWNHGSGQTIQVKASAEVDVRDCARERTTSIYKAMELWMDRDIAKAFQTGVELTESARKKLYELKTNYADTVYGKWAEKLLERHKSR